MVEDAVAQACPLCGFKMLTHGRRQRTVDHIIPRSWGERWPVLLFHRTHRPMCRLCNERRAKCGHCVGAMACIDAVRVPGRRKPSSSGFMAVFKRWGIGRVAATIRPPRL